MTGIKLNDIANEVTQLERLLEIMTDHGIVENLNCMSFLLTYRETEEKIERFQKEANHRVWRRAFPGGDYV